MFIQDTDPSMQNEVITRIRRLSPADRLRRACEFSTAIRKLVQSEIRGRYPDYSEHELRACLARRFLTPELASYFDRTTNTND